MPHKCSGMQNILNGFLRYRAQLNGKLKQQFESIGDNPKPKSIFITCIDSRIVASRITEANPGETFMSRNPGSLIPNYNILPQKTPRPEEAVLELACLHNQVDTIVICGHSDCKAMNLVYENRKSPDQINPSDGFLKRWLMSNSKQTIAKYAELERSEFKKPINISINDRINFKAYIDPENRFAFNDKFSQLNTLSQLENLKQYKFVKDLIDTKKTKVYAMWLDIYTGDIFVFCYKENRFLVLDDSSYDRLVTSLNTY